MGPGTPLPLPAEFNSTDEYVDSLLEFTTSSWLLQTLCGGVHILDFYTREPDLYSAIVPRPWREWFKSRDIMDILDLLMREDLDQFKERACDKWRNGPVPPEDLLLYIRDVRKHLLARDFPAANSTLKSQKPALPRHIALGMKVKKVHEVDNFACYVDKLTAEIAASGKKPITHLVDFGSGQNYLGRALAAPPYSKHIVAVESKQHNIEGAKNMDVLAKLVPKPLVMRNKKEYRARTGKGKKKKNNGDANPTVPRDEAVNPSAEEASLDTEIANEIPSELAQNSSPSAPQLPIEDTCDDDCKVLPPSQPTTEPTPEKAATNGNTPESTNQQRTKITNLQVYTEGQGSVQYVEHVILDGDLTPVINQVLDSSRAPHHNTTSTTTTTESIPVDTVPKPANVNAMVISLHSCGNLVHHGLRSLLLNPHISAVAMVGCCYNLVTERLGPPTYKLPSLRPNHPRLEATANAWDPHGFPMSEKLASYPLPSAPVSPFNNADVHEDREQSRNEEVGSGTGLRLNITARMMAVQAPYNWGRTDSDLFFTRHFYRALLQRIFLDRGVISAPLSSSTSSHPAVSAAGHTSHLLSHTRGPGLSSPGTTTTPLTIGTLRKFAYTDFISYVRAAIAKLTTPNAFCDVNPTFIADKLSSLTDKEIRDYEETYRERKKELSVMWSLMAFSAGVVESVVVVDRWLWLKEQEEVEEAWVESVFEYRHSPRNLVVVGVKKERGNGPGV